MNKKTLIISLALTLAGGGSAAAYWWYINQPEHRLARAQELIAANDTTAAVDILSDLVLQGNPDADHQLARLNADGKIAAPDATTAVRWYSILADQGHTNSMCKLADCYAKGHGVEKNPAEAIKLFEKSLQANDAEGHYTLALCYHETGAADKAEQYMGMAAALGHVGAQAVEGCRLFDAKEYAKAYSMLKVAAASGNAPSAARLSLCYKYALGTSRHAEFATQWEDTAKAGGIDPATLPSPISVLVKSTGEQSSPEQESPLAAEKKKYAAPTSGHHPLTKNLYKGAQIELPDELYSLLEEENRELREKLPPAEYMQLLRGEQAWWSIYQMAKRDFKQYDSNMHGDMIRDYNNNPGEVGTPSDLKSLLRQLVQNPKSDVIFPRVMDVTAVPAGISYRETPQNSSATFTYGDQYVLASQRPAVPSAASKALPEDSYWDPGVIHTFWDTRTGEQLISTTHYSTFIYTNRQQDGTYAMRAPSTARRREYMYGGGGNTLGGIPLLIDSYIDPYTGVTGTPGRLAHSLEETCEFEYYTVEEHAQFARESACEDYELEFNNPNEGEGNTYIENKAFFSRFICGESAFSYMGDKNNYYHNIKIPAKSTLTAIDLQHLKYEREHITPVPFDYENEDRENKELISAAIARLLIQPVAEEIKHNEEFLQKELGIPFQMRRPTEMDSEQSVTVDTITAGRGSKETIAFELHASNDNEAGDEEYIASRAYYIGIWHKGKAWLLTAPEDSGEQGHGALQGEGKLMALEDEKKQNARDPKLLSWPCRSFLHTQEEDGDSVLLTIGARAKEEPAGATYKGVQQVRVDFSTGTVHYLRHWEFGPQHMSADPLWLENQNLLLLPENDNSYRIIKTDAAPDSAEIGKLYISVNDGYAIVLNNGMYAGSPGCESMLQFSDGYRSIHVQSLAPWRNRPAEVLQALGGNPDDVAALRESTNRWLTQMGFSPDAMGEEPRINELPIVTVDMPELYASEREVSFTVHMQATANDIVKLEVLHNGVNIPQQPENTSPTEGSGTHTVTTQLAEGTNWFEVTAIDCYGNRSNTRRFRVISSAKTPPGKLYMVALGVSQYDQQDLNLQYAAKDAGDLAASFKKFHAGDTETLVLLNEQVKDATVLEQVRDFISRAESQDRVILYLAGHGMLDDKLDYHYAPASFDVDNIAATGISMQSLLDTIDSTRALTRLLLLDTCHSGILSEADADKMALSMGKLPHGVRAIQHRGMKVKKVDSALSSTQKKRYIDEMFTTGNMRRGISVLAGAAGAEFALESGEWQNGIFTASLIEALNGGLSADINQDGKINVAELYQAVVTAVTEKTNGAQRPNTSLLENKGEQVIAHSLGYFILKKDWVTVEKMINQGYRLSSTFTPGEPNWLIFAAENGAPAHIRELLIRAGAAVDIKELVGWDIPYADKLKFLKYTLKSGNRRNIDQAFLQSVSGTDNNEITLLLLKYGANVNATDAWDQTALMLANTEDKVRLLLEHGADEKAQNGIICVNKPGMLHLIKELKGDEFIRIARLQTPRLVNIVSACSSTTISDAGFRSNKVRHIVTVLNNCAPTVRTPYGETTRENLVDFIKQHTPIKTPYSKYSRILNVARKGNEIEILFHRTWHGVYNTQAPPAYYELIHAQFDECGRLTAWTSTTSTKEALPISEGMQEEPGWKPGEHAPHDDMKYIPVAASASAGEKGDLILSQNEVKQHIRNIIDLYIMGDTAGFAQAYICEKVIDLESGKKVPQSEIIARARKLNANMKPFPLVGGSYNYRGNMLELMLHYDVGLRDGYMRSIVALFNQDGRISAICEQTGNIPLLDNGEHRLDYIPAQNIPTSTSGKTTTNKRSKRR